ncbi:MAG: kinase/pyrophosphorylase [Bacteroidetes bacterium]|nr:kinase/pyrophosphorylase [Bacteroidota bacterium]
MYFVIVVSDGTGRTAEQALNAAFTQYEGMDLEIIVKPGILTRLQVLEVVQEAVEKKAFIVHTLVSNEIRGVMLDTARRLNVETIDLMGPLLLRLSNLFANAPAEKPGLFHEVNRDYFRRIEAMEYTFRHDDGQRENELDKADIILLGVSRTFKTPLSIYLAIKGWLVANVPIVLGVQPPAILSQIDPKKIFGLTTYPSRLAQLRQTRHEHLGGLAGNYATYEYVTKELRYAHNIYQFHPKWAVINVTSKAIEEIASEILDIYNRHSW